MITGGDACLQTGGITRVLRGAGVAHKWKDTGAIRMIRHTKKISEQSARPDILQLQHSETK